MVDSRETFSGLDEASKKLVNNLLERKKRSIWALDLPVWDKIELLDYVMREMALDFYARKEVIPVESLISDEGITQNFANELLLWNEECAKNNHSCIKALKDFMRGRAIIMLDACNATILENLKSRHADYHGKYPNDLLAYWSEEKVLEKTLRDRNTARELLALAASLGVRTLFIDISEGLDVGKREVLHFLNDIKRMEHVRDKQPQPV